MKNTRGLERDYNKKSGLKEVDASGDDCQVELIKVQDEKKEWNLPAISIAPTDHLNHYKNLSS